MNTTIDCILNHSLNTSKSKQTHTFSRTSRFTQPKYSYCHQFAYNLPQFPSKISSKKIFIMGADRFAQTFRDIQRKSLSPSPGLYQTQARWGAQNKNQKFTTFGASQKFTYKTPKIPGPGSYHDLYNPQAQLSYTMRKRIPPLFSSQNKTGPGQYDPKQQYLSTSTNSNIKIPQQPRFKIKYNSNPSPDAYPIEQIKTQPTTKFKQSSKFTFGKKFQIKQKRYTPGPGSYQEFSEFNLPLTRRNQK